MQGKWQSAGKLGATVNSERIKRGMRSSRSHVWLIRPAQSSLPDAPRNAPATFHFWNVIPAASRYSNFAILSRLSSSFPLPSPAFFPRRLSLERPRHRLQAPLINFDSNDPPSLSLSLALLSRVSSMDDIFDRIFGRRVADSEEAWKRVNLKDLL